MVVRTRNLFSEQTNGVAGSILGVGLLYAVSRGNRRPSPPPPSERRATRFLFSFCKSDRKRREGENIGRAVCRGKFFDERHRRTPVIDNDSPARRGWKKIASVRLGAKRTRAIENLSSRIARAVFNSIHLTRSSFFSLLIL